VSISSSDLLEFAEQVFSAASCEPGYRNSVNRSYYAAMHCCRGIQAAMPGVTEKTKKKSRAHARLINSLLSPESAEPSVREKSMRLGLDLQAIKTLRNVADYDLGKTITRLDAEDTLESARLFFEEA